MRNKALVVSAGIVVVVALASGGGYALYKKSQSVKASDSRQNLQAALENMKARAENPDQKPYKEMNMPQLKEKLSLATPPADRAKTVQAGIVFFDLGLGKAWSPAQYDALASDLLDTLSETPKLPEEKRLRNLSFQLAKRILPKTTAKDVVSKIDSLLNVKRADAYDNALFIELASVSPTTPDHFVEAHHKCLSSKDSGVAQSCLQMIEQIPSERTREQVAKNLLGAWKALKAPLQPYAVKTLMSQHAFFEKAAQDLLTFSSKGKGELWTDVFIYGVSQMNAVDHYRPELEKIASSSDTISLRQRASELLRAHAEK